MPRIRLILAWLLMAAVPLQGWAAATMLFCGPMPPSVHAHAHEAGGQTDLHAAPAAHHHGMNPQHATHDDGTAAHPQPVGDESHACSACAACSHSIALAQTQLPATVSGV